MAGAQMRRAGIAFGALILGLGPWIGLVRSAPAPAEHEQTWFPAAAHRLDPGSTKERIRPAVVRRSAGSSCTCRTVDVNANNFVRDADIRTGDARVKNINITYVSAGFVQGGDAEIEIDQEAEAISGDAIAGQILSVAARSADGCTRVVVHATNDVADSELRSGDARATNRNFVLLDPAVDRGSVEIEVDQDATAKSGETIAGQVLGVSGGGGPCGGVDVVASNRVKNVELETGEARIDNDNTITQCESEGCAKELLRLLRRQHLDSVQMCGADGCTDVTAKELKETINAQRSAEGPDTEEPEDEETDKDADDEPTPTPSDEAPFLDAESSAEQEPTPTPTPTPSPEAGDFGSESAMADQPPDG